MINSTNIEKAVFWINSSQEGDCIEIYANDAGLLLFIRELSRAIKNPSLDPVTVVSTEIPQSLREPTTILLDKLIISQANAWQMQPEHPSLSFEWDQGQHTVEVHSNSSGLESLRDTCTRLANRPGMDHSHLMVPEWGGDELSEACFNLDHVPIKHVKICKWYS